MIGIESEIPIVNENQDYNQYFGLIEAGIYKSDLNGS